jgi:hypothetical protein
MKTSNVHILDTSKLTVEQALADATTQGFSRVVIMGEVDGEDEYYTTHSGMTRKDMLWLLTREIQHVTGV